MAFLIPLDAQYFDNNASPAPGALANFYETGTTTFKNTYTTSALSVANTNPLVADSAGRFGPAYIADSAVFKWIITDSTAATTLQERDPVTAPPTASTGAINRTYETKVADYTLVAGDNNKYIDFDASGGDRVATANSATLGNGYFVTIGRRSTSGLVTITPGALQVIDGASSYVIDTDYESVTIDSMGATGWRVIGRTSTEPVGELPLINAQTGVAYTLVIGDKGAKVTMSNVAANILTIPTNASVPYPLLTRIEVSQIGAGQTSIAAAVGVTTQSFSSWLKILGQYAGVILTKTATNTWLIEGNLSA